MINQTLAQHVCGIVKTLFDVSVVPTQIQIQKTPADFAGDLTIVVFPFVKAARKSPEQTAQLIGENLKQQCDTIADFNIVKGFLNLVISDIYYVQFLQEASVQTHFGIQSQNSSQPMVVEYSSPNTNKPLHLGHIRNNLIGWSVSEILKANGHHVKMVNLVNDRGIHICKSMLAWQRFGNGETPTSSGLKGDHLVGKYYVLFDQYYKEEIANLVSTGITPEEATKQAPILLAAQEMLRKWESGDPDTVTLWKTMNQWVYDGFEKTYQTLGIHFDKIYYESETYLLGKSIVLSGLSKGLLQQRSDQSVWADLTADGLDEKLLLRSDGTSVYMTQDLGTACLRIDEFNPQKMIYVVGNEQNYHFEVLKLVLRKLGYTWSDNIEHLSYGMVELPEGKMKSREGTVVDADDLVESMTDTARQTTEALGKTEHFSEDERQHLYHAIAMGALKYFILKVDPAKNMLFNPKESIDFNGNTGPFIQYTHARIHSLLRKADVNDMKQPVNTVIPLIDKEKTILSLLHDFPDVVQQAGDNCSPALIANYVFDLAKEYNSFYQDTPILREANDAIRQRRLQLSKLSANVIHSALTLLGIEALERM
ncbi:arginine--tRNA ligase [Bacteroidia bacterium]|nr:arginine--tRNA ligase [Bacteroidia bacterium]